MAEPAVCKRGPAISHEKASYRATDTEESTKTERSERSRRSKFGETSVTLFVKLPIARFLASGRLHVKDS